MRKKTPLLDLPAALLQSSPISRSGETREHGKLVDFDLVRVACLYLYLSIFIHRLSVSATKKTRY